MGTDAKTKISSDQVNPEARQKGGVSESIRYIQTCLMRPEKGEDSIKACALLEVADLLRIIISQALNNDSECGFFLGEVIPALAKKREKLNSANERFKRRCCQIQSVQASRSNSSTSLRRRLENYVSEAQRLRRTMRLWDHMVRKHGVPRVASPKITASDKKLRALPDLIDSDAVIDTWLRHILADAEFLSELEQDPDISRINQAKGKRGKFQPSKLEPLIRKTLKNIANLPKTYYVDL